eukprot:TRINITY_DN35471_c0_g1_i1.p1 TRINITY_DN35471_c0_g1~~TRINITY_DN35471_c0_g1_i1.p1  ORF type:complete len:292 (-),score=41.95 TRINITY_DN35471_c0_g1_i1:226-1101(-)
MALSAPMSLGYLRELGEAFSWPEGSAPAAVIVSAIAPAEQLSSTERPAVAAESTPVVAAPAATAGSENSFKFSEIASGAALADLEKSCPLLKIDISCANNVNTEQETPPENLLNFDGNFTLCLQEMSKAGLFEGSGPATKLYLHPPVYTCEQASKLCGSHHPHCEMKNLFLKDKKKNLFLVSALESTDIKLKQLKLKGAASGGLGFASSDLLFEAMHLIPGSVTPFGLLNDRDAKKITYYLDENALTAKCEYLGFHPNACNATVGIHRDVFRKFIEQVTGHEVHVLTSPSE